MIEQLLKQLGFREKEIKVYLTILERGKITPGNISRLTGINRSTIYSISKELLEKGVIIEDVGIHGGSFVALPSENLKNLVKKEERQLQNKKTLINQAMSELQNITKDTKYSVPKINFVHEEDLEDFFYKQTPEWIRSIMSRDSTWWGFQDPSLVATYQKYINWFWKDSNAPKELSLKLLTNESDVEEKMSKLDYKERQMKFWKKGSDFTATTWVNGDYIVMVITNQHPYYLVQIHDETLAHNMREMFKSIWEVTV